MTFIMSTQTQWNTSTSPVVKELAVVRDVSIDDDQPSSSSLESPGNDLLASTEIKKTPSDNKQSWWSQPSLNISTWMKVLISNSAICRL